MPDANDHSRIKGKYNEWVIEGRPGDRFVAILQDGATKMILMSSASKNTREEAAEIIKRATSGNVMNRFTDTTL